MKELEKTKRISISAILVILALIIGLLTMKTPEITYVNCKNKSLANLIEQPIFITLKQYKEIKDKTVIIDIRTAFDFSKGHLEEAINIPLTSLLEKSSLAIFDKAKTDSITAVLYGKSAMDANKASTFLRQIGYTNTKVIAIETSFDSYELTSKEISPETLLADIPSFIKKSNERKKVVIKKTIIKKPKPRKVIPIKKKKKYESEGGC